MDFFNMNNNLKVEVNEKEKSITCVSSTEKKQMLSFVASDLNSCAPVKQQYFMHLMNDIAAQVNTKQTFELMSLNMLGEPKNFSTSYWIKSECEEGDYKVSLELKSSGEALSVEYKESIGTTKLNVTLELDSLDKLPELESMIGNIKLAKRVLKH